VFDRAGFAAQKRHAEISGVRGTYYCGAWWGWGFHEDGVNSALAVARQFGIEGIPPRRTGDRAEESTDADTLPSVATERPSRAPAPVVS
jgi:predicted NAD/FAD-binding protein